MAKKSFFKQSASVSANAITTLLEVTKPTKFLKNGAPKGQKIKPPPKWGRWFLLTGLTTIVLLIMGLIGVGWWYIHSFEITSGVSATKILSTYWQQRNANQLAQKNVVTFLLLGLDQSQNQREASLLTDTIIVAKYTKSEHTLTLYSLPRDLWIDSLKTKINALYYYGQQDGDGGGITLLSSVIKEITDLPVDYYAIMNMDSLRQIVDALGGVNVTVERSFTDTLYPREIDLSSTDPSVLYETVTFTAGSELMNGNRALQYIRSRHSKDELEGTDEGREQRQQRLLDAVKSTLLQPTIITNPQVLGRLYTVWKEAFKTNITDTDLIALVKSFGMGGIHITSATIPIQDATTSGLLFHPAKGPANQWVYLPVDATWAQLKQWFNQ